MSSEFDAHKKGTGQWSFAGIRIVYLGGMLVLLALVGLVYADVVGFEYLPGFDDELYLFARPVMREGWWSVSWRQRLLTPNVGYPLPVPTAIYSLFKWGFGSAFPHSLHALQVVLHGANTLLVYAIAARWTENRRLGLLVGAAWGLHPLCVETVSWLTNLKTTLYGTSAFSAILLALKIPDFRTRWVDYWDLTGIALMVLALGCRPGGLLIPGMMWAVLCRRTDAWTALRRVAVPAGVMVVFAVWYLPVAMTGHSEMVTGISSKTVLNKGWFAAVARAFELSISHVVWPLDLQPSYFRKLTPEWRDMVPGFAMMAVCIGVCVWAKFKEYRGVFSGLLMFGIAYLPYSQVRPLPRLTADTYMYVPLVGLLLAAVSSVQVGLNYLRSLEGVRASRIRWVVLVASGIWLATMTVVTTHRVDRWKSTQSLWLPYAASHMSNWKPFAYAGQAFFDSEQYAMAASTYVHGLFAFRLHRKYPPVMIAAFERAGAPKKAWALLLEGLRKGDPPNPRLYKELLRFIATYDWAESEEVGDKIFRESVQRYASDPDWMKLDGIRRRLMILLAASNQPELASTFIEWELRHIDPPHCAVWAARNQVEAPGELGMIIPTRPPRCSGVSEPEGFWETPDTRRKDRFNRDPGGETGPSPRPE